MPKSIEADAATGLTDSDVSTLFRSLPAPVEERTQAIGREIFESSRLTLFNRNFWYTQLLELATSDLRVKTQLFRFVDVLPVLKTSQQKKEHLIEYLSPSAGAKKWPWILKVIVALLKVPGLDRLMVAIADFQVRQMAKNFIVGNSWEQAWKKLQVARERKLAFTLDILGETVFSEGEAEYYTEQYRQLIDQIGRRKSELLPIKQIDEAASGPIPAVNISLKLSALDCRMDPAAHEASVIRLIERVEPMMRLAVQRGVFINFDMETFALREIYRDVFKRILMKEEFRRYRHFGIVVQAYQRTSLGDVHDWIRFARERGTPFTIRLVKGAYWDYEVIVAQQSSWLPPVYDYKFESDANYEECTRAMLDAYPDIELAIGSHNVRSISHALAYAEWKKLPLSALEVQMLYGMADPFKDALVKRGVRVREYDPVGEMLPGLSYLVRRLLENSANDSFLKQSFMDKTGIRELLKTPQDKRSSSC